MHIVQIFVILELVLNKTNRLFKNALIDLKLINLQLYPCEICSSNTVANPQLARVQPLVSSVFEAMKNDRGSRDTVEVKTESSPPLPPAVLNERVIHERFQVSSISFLILAFQALFQFDLSNFFLFCD